MFVAQTGASKKSILRKLDQLLIPSNSVFQTSYNKCNPFDTLFYLFFTTGITLFKNSDFGDDPPIAKACVKACGTLGTSKNYIRNEHQTLRLRLHHLSILLPLGYGS